MVAELVEDLEQEVVPVYADLRLFAEAYEAWADFHRYGMPYSGGSLEQPENWRLMMDCMHRARAQADRELSEEEEMARRFARD
jgi:hypothetical protein